VTTGPVGDAPPNATAAPRPWAGRAPSDALGPAAARRALIARVRRRPAWLVASVAAGTLAGLAALPQALLLTGILDGAFLGGRDLSALRAPLLWLAVVVAGRAAALFAATHAGHRAGARVARDLRGELTARLLERGPAYLERHASGALGAEVLEGVDRVEPFVARFLPQAALIVLVPTAIALGVLRLDLLAGLILLTTGPLIPLFLWLLGALAERRAQRQWRALSLLSAQAQDALQGLETLRLFGRASAHESAMARAGERYRRVTLDVLKVAFLSGFALEMLAMLGTAMVAVAVGLRLANGALTFPVALATLLLAPEFYLPFRQLGAHHHAAMEGIAAMRDLLAHGIGAEEPGTDVPAPGLATATAVADAPTRPGERASTEAPGRAAPTPVAVTLRGVHARYPGSDRDALRALDLDIGPGGITALVGPTGAGKSSLARLLIGTLPPSAGTVLVDGAPRPGFGDEAWRARLAFVPQRPHLFTGSVLTNLRLARPDATQDEIIEAARLAEADAFIRTLPQGYATVLGEDGRDLAGGERQRLAIARAFVRRADLVILDEISAHLDAPTERAIGRAVDRLARRATVLVIAHRLATVRRADRIAVVSGGCVVEQGTHDQLAARGGLYARLTGEIPVAPTGTR
jgi:thiol reductant ABC exporter CydD subunit